MGGGQNEAALQLLKESAEEGKWLFFKNLHLVPAFLTELEKAFKTVKKVKGFKLWLTSEEQNKFPVVFLETCFKVSYESPPGLQLNVERIYLTIQNNEFKRYTQEKARMIFLLAYFHAVLQERRTYIPQGWSKYYEFSQSDFKAGKLILDQVINEEKVDWSGLYGLLENAIHGGRIDRKQDMEIMKAYMRKIFNAENLVKQRLTTGIQAPTSNKLKDHLKVIQALPDNNSPQVFGLPDIIASSLQKKNANYTKNCLKNLVQVGSQQNSDAQEDAGQLVEQTIPYVNLWK